LIPPLFNERAQKAMAQTTTIEVPLTDQDLAVTEFFS
jgi:hypothetical protein